MYWNKYNWVKRVCVIDSAYSLLLYFLISSEEEIMSTYYFWGKGVPEQVRHYFKGREYYIENKPLFKNRFEEIICGVKYRLNFLKWPFLLKKNITYWGHDHLSYSCMVVHNHKMNIIEDGTGNYHSKNVGKIRKIRKILFGPVSSISDYCFQSPYCDKEYLTDLIPNTPCTTSPKAVIISLDNLWSEAPTSKRNLILNIYGVSFLEITELKTCKNILLTQPLSEDYYLTEQEKIKLYKSIIKEYHIQDLLIKPHPRETTDYKIYFPDCIVFSKKIPIELFSLIGVHFKNVYSLTSTAAYNIAKDNNARVIMCKDRMLCKRL